MNLTPKDPAGSTFANNIAVMVNGVVNRDYRTGPGQIMDGNLYWKMNTVDAVPLLSRFDTVAEFSAATGLEKRGIGAEPKRGTDPLFRSFRPRFVDTSRAASFGDRLRESLRASKVCSTMGRWSGGVSLKWLIRDLRDGGRRL